MLLLFIASTALILVPVGVSDEPTNMQVLMETIQGSHRVGVRPTPALEAIAALRRSLRESETLDDEVAAALLAVVSDRDANTLVRKAALGLTCERASNEATGLVLQTVQALLERQRMVRDGNDSEFYSITPVLHEFVSTGASQLATRLESQAPLLDLFIAILSEPKIPHGHIRQPCFERIADNPAPLPVRQRYMLEVVKALAGNRAPPAFVGLINDDVVGSLRSIAFDGPLGSQGYNAAALDLLADYGDRETAERFRQWAGERGIDEAAVTRVGGYVWMIEAQHHPDMLLSHIRSDEWINHQTRPWALERAIRLGVDKGKLRTALLEHARRAEDDKRLHYDMARLREIALKNGIVDPSDLPTFDQP